MTVYNVHKLFSFLYMGLTKEVAKLFACFHLEVTEFADSDCSLCVR